ncbi:MAG TPA: hypothetical protein VKU94_00765 [Geobacterales bacterium]|nr:hypothetical protein [Geobacterales bacterium]
MVLSAKVFLVEQEMSLEEIRKKLKDYRTERIEEHEGKPIKLETKIEDIFLKDDVLSGLYSNDFVIYVNQHGLLNPIIKTYDAQFRFIKGSKLFLVIFEKKRLANYIANELSKILFIKSGKITEIRIDPQIMQKHHEENRENTKVIFFDDIKIPSIEKLSLYGEKLADTELYHEYLKQGKIWYLVYVSKITGKTVGLTRNGIIVHFDKISLEDFFAFIKNEILKLVS